ncbi:MAG TPA: hypothetical protein VJ799_07295 [Nitrososphaeraceae archaeon]|nr:hypothetical protein [Nitrososphaeraceae archaeon]
MNTIPLNLDEIHRRRELTQLFSEDKINRQQAEELRNLLEREKFEAAERGNFAVLLAIAFLIGLVVGWLANQK